MSSRRILSQTSTRVSEKKEVDAENSESSLIYLRTEAARKDEMTREEFRMEDDRKPASGPNFDPHTGT